MIGTVLRIRYQLNQEISDSGLFTTYRAKDNVSAREISIRLIDPPMNQEAGFISKLREVVAISSAVQHPSVERLLEVDDHEGVPFVIGEFSEGQTLEERIRKLAPFSSAVAVSTGLGVCDALDAIHTAGLVHGDVSPENIVINAEGEVRLQLCGIWESYSASQRAGAIALPAMAPYLAPEITDGGMPSAQSDIYALGVVLYRLLSGRFPFSGDTPGSIAVKHATAPVPSVRTINAGVPLALDSIVRKAMAKSPADRYDSARQIMSDLRMVQDALRFGRSLNWSVNEPKVSEPQPIAPKMNAIQDEVKKKSYDSRRSRADERDLSDELPKWLTFLGYLGIIAMIAAIGGWVYFNLSKPKEVPVPDIVRLTVNEANKRLQLAKLKMKVTRHEASEEFPEGTIIDTNPSVGDRARENGTVTVTVSSGNQFVVVPDLKGRTVDEAKDVLSAMNLTLDERIVEVRDRNAPRGTIVSQLPEARRKVQRGSRIRVHISGGSRGGTDVAFGSEYTYTVKIKLPSGDTNMVVRVDMTDDRETKTVYEEPHSPGDEFEVTAEGYGDEVTFRIFFDNELVKQVTKSAADAEPRNSNE